MLRKLALSFCLVILSACATTSLTGNSNMFNDEYLRTNLIPGKTTQADVRQLFGEPATKTVLSGISTVVWKYDNNQSTNFANSALSSLTGMIPGGGMASAATSGTRANTKILSIRFSTAGILKDYSATVQ